MKLRHLFTSAFLATILSGVNAQEVSKQYFVTKPGTLISLMTEAEANSITHLTLTGRINSEDFRRLRDGFGKLQVLDLSNVDIKMFAGKTGTHPDKFYIYMANFIPAYAFCRMENGQAKGKLSLRKVILSEEIRNIEDAAFKGCNNLSVLRINRKTPPNLLPEALADSITAVFVPAGSTDEYRRKNRWETFAFIEGTPVEASLQVSSSGNLETEIQKAGIQPKNINFLTVEGKLDAPDFKLIRDYMPNLVAVDISHTNATVIPEFTFAQKRDLLRISLPHELKTIGRQAFSNCTRLSGTLTLPPGIAAIEYGAFLKCDNLHRVLVTGNNLTTLGEKLFGDGVVGRLVYESK